MDKMTPNKRTSQMDAICNIVPVPSNPLSDVMFAPVMLEVPSFTHHDADSLAAEMTTVFDWFVEHISVANSIIQTLQIGKGLEHCLTAAEEQNRRLYRVTNLSSTRFVSLL